MSLLITIPVICLLFNLVFYIVKWLNISKLFVPKTIAENVALEAKLEKAKENLIIVKNAPLSEGNNDCMINYALIERNWCIDRAMGKIRNIEGDIRSNHTRRRIKIRKINKVAGNVLMAILLPVLIIISICYRHTPVIVFDDQYNFTPLTSVLSYPTGVHNAISVPVWVLFCHFSLLRIIVLIKGLKLFGNVVPASTN